MRTEPKWTTKPLVRLSCVRESSACDGLFLWLKCGADFNNAQRLQIWASCDPCAAAADLQFPVFCQI